MSFGFTISRPSVRSERSSPIIADFEKGSNPRFGLRVRFMILDQSLLQPFCISTVILRSRRRPWPRPATGRCMASNPCGLTTLSR